MAGPANTFPHIRNEVESSALVAPLAYRDCEKRYALIKHKTKGETLAIVLEYPDKNKRGGDKYK